MRKALNDYTCLNQDEKGRFFAVIIGYVGAWDNIRAKYEAGFLDEAIYNSITISFASLLQTPGGYACIQQVHEGFGLPPHILKNTSVESVSGHKIMSYVDCLDFLKKVP